MGGPNMEYADQQQAEHDAYLGDPDVKRRMNQLSAYYRDRVFDGTMSLEDAEADFYANANLVGGDRAENFEGGWDEDGYWMGSASSYQSTGENPTELARMNADIEERRTLVASSPDDDTIDRELKRRRQAGRKGMSTLLTLGSGGR